MSSTTTRDRATTSTGIALPLMALPQKRPETVDECAIPLTKATVWLWYPSSRIETGFRPQRVVCPHDFALPVRGIATSGPAFDPTRFRTTRCQHRLGRTAFRDSQACRPGGDAWRFRSSVLGVVAKTESCEAAA
jgi:hypothetical protein